MPLTLGLRPRLELEIPGRSEEITRRVRAANTDYRVTATDFYLVINIPVERQHYWSPHLQIEFDEKDDRVRISGLITPMPAVWTMFAGVYAVILVLGFFGTIYGLAQKQIGQPATWLWSIPIALFLIACVYVAALAGQHMGREQTNELLEFLHECVKEKRKERQIKFRYAPVPPYSSSCACFSALAMTFWAMLEGTGS